MYIYDADFISILNSVVDPLLVAVICSFFGFYVEIFPLFPFAITILLLFQFFRSFSRSLARYGFDLFS